MSSKKFRKRNKVRDEPSHRDDWRLIAETSGSVWVDVLWTLHSKLGFDGEDLRAFVDWANAVSQEMNNSSVVVDERTKELYRLMGKNLSRPKNVMSFSTAMGASIYTVADLTAYAHAQRAELAVGCHELNNLAWLVALHEEGFGKTRLERVYARLESVLTDMHKRDVGSVYQELYDATGYPPKAEVKDIIK